MGHELRTPLNGVIQLSTALLRGAGGLLNEKGTKWVETMHASSLHLLDIINDIILVGALKVWL